MCCPQLITQHVRSKHRCPRLARPPLRMTMHPRTPMYTPPRTPLLCAYCEQHIATCACPTHPFRGIRARVYESVVAQPGTNTEIAARLNLSPTSSRTALTGLVRIGYLTAHTRRLKIPRKGRLPHVYAAVGTDPDTLPGDDPDALASSILTLLAERPRTSTEIGAHIPIPLRTIRGEIYNLRIDKLITRHRYGHIHVYSVGGNRPNPEDYIQ